MEIVGKRKKVWSAW